MQDTDPYERYPPGQPIALSFSGPVDICVKGIPEPWHWDWFPIPQVNRIGFPRAWGSVQLHLQGESKP